MVLSNSQNSLMVRTESPFLPITQTSTSISVTATMMHPEIEVWETCTPYFDRRNIHFYINRCGFHAIEFFNEHHPDPHMPDQFDQEDGLFKFEKRMI